MVELEMWLASASDATGWVFSFQIGLSLGTTRGLHSSPVTHTLGQ